MIQPRLQIASLGEVASSRVQKKADQMPWDQLSTSTPCVNDGFLHLALSRLAGETTEGVQAVKTFSTAC